MELLLLGILVGVGTGLVRYRSIGGLATHTLKGERVVVLVMVIQGAVPVLGRFMGIGDGAITALWVLMTTSLLLLAIANSDRCWMLLAACGLVLNIVVVSANGGMPVDLSRIVDSRVTTARARLDESPIHVEADEKTNLAFLGDRIPVPLGRTRRGLVSIGDCVLAIGAMLVAYDMMKVAEHP
ncbi:MAG: DUF5317 family protein [Actinomycetota bacterium]|nr:DUF5317 family protein [Actinomycetota bacterium]